MRFSASPFHQDKTKFDAKFISVPAIDSPPNVQCLSPGVIQSPARAKGEDRQTFTLSIFRSL
jgi:hypothetical protein